MNVLEELRLELRRILEYQNGEEKEFSLVLSGFEVAQTPRDLIAVDGSYTFLWNVSSTWLAMVKVGALHFKHTPKGYHVKSLDKLEKAFLISTSEDFPADDGLYSSIFRFTKGSKEQHREMVNEFRKYYESEVALRAAKSGKELVIALDGTLASFPKDTDRLGAVVEACEDMGHILVGVSKDSATHAFGHRLTDEELLRKEEGMAFVRVPEDFERRQKGLLHGDVYFSRLHPDSPKWFRVDVGTYKETPQFALSHLAAYCSSPLCVGYPYPLFEAHRFAVTVRQMRDMYEDTIIREGLGLGLPLGLLISGLTSMEGERRGAFHEYLDKVTRELK
ncbi:MAG: DNA double-strand break repair nuclease NurA [Thermoplasmata archaeon]